MASRRKRGPAAFRLRLSRVWLSRYLLWPELITGPPPRQFDSAIITRLDALDSCGLLCPHWVTSRLSPYYHLGGCFRAVVQITGKVIPRRAQKGQLTFNSAI